MMNFTKPENIIIIEFKRLVSVSICVIVMIIKKMYVLTTKINMFNLNIHRENYGLVLGQAVNNNQILLFLCNMTKWPQTD